MRRKQAVGYQERLTISEADLGENLTELKPLVVVFKFSVASFLAKKPYTKGKTALN